MSSSEPASTKGYFHSPSAAMRAVHRWIALVFAVFMLMFGLSGTILQALLAVYGEPGGMNGPVFLGAPPWVNQLHWIALKLHTGSYLGAEGSWYGLVCGLALLFFSISGLWMYVNLYRARAGFRLRGLFWTTKQGADATMRSLHRWATVVLVAFMTIIAFTASYIDFDFARIDGTPPPGNGPWGVPGMPGPPRAPATSGRPPPPRPGAAWHEFLIYVHRIDFLGAAGHWLGVIAGAGLTLFAVSGAWMYVAMISRRSKAGRVGLFW